MSTDTERVTLTDEEREALACVATGHEPALCDCHDGYRDAAYRFCEYAQETFSIVERIVAAREQALREQIAGEIEAHGARWDHSPDWRGGVDEAADIARGIVR